MFLGASYFRARGSDSRQFGLSARGLAIDTALDVEEFPRFVAFWLERPAPDARTLVFYGLLDSVSAAGAYRFALTPGAPQVIEVDAAVYPRKPIRRLGIAPLTSMYQCGENDRRMANDWRPEIHDSDGLAICTGKGEWIWRPLSNPAATRISSYLDENPRGFGLLQRDRNFDHYQDDGVFYDRRPSVWIEPKARLGERRDPARRADRAERNVRQHRRVLESRDATATRRRTAVRLSHVLGHAAAGGADARANGRDAHRSRRRHRPQAATISRGASRSTSPAASSPRSRRARRSSPSSASRAARSKRPSARPLQVDRRLSRDVRLEADRTRASSRSISGCSCGIDISRSPRRGFISGRRHRRRSGSRRWSLASKE